jgi:hypothetical protein
MDESKRRPRLWTFTQDLLFSSRIASAAERKGIEYRRIGEGDFTDLDAEGGLLLVDLDIGVDSARRALIAARQDDPNRWFLCVYGAHVDREGLATMQTAGADLVLSRSRLLGRLETILADLFPSNP